MNVHYIISISVLIKRPPACQPALEGQTVVARKGYSKEGLFELGGLGDVKDNLATSFANLLNVGGSIRLA